MKRFAWDLDFKTTSSIPVTLSLPDGVKGSLKQTTASL